MLSTVLVHSHFARGLQSGRFIHRFVLPLHGDLLASNLDVMDRNETTVITKAGPEDMIATVWFSLGYKPQNSLMLLGLEGPRQRVGVLLRVDLPRKSGKVLSGMEIRPIDRLPPDQQRALVPEMVRDLLLTVAASGADGVLAIVADEHALDRRPPAVVRTLRKEVREFGLRLMDVLGVTSKAFASLMCHDPRCCPPGGRPIARVMSSRSAAVHVVGGDTVAESEADLLSDVTPGPLDPPCDPPSLVELASDQLGDPPSPDWLSVEDRWRWWERWSEAAAAAARVPSRGEPLRGLSAALHDCFLRDAVLMGLLGAEEEEVREMLNGSYAWMMGPFGPPSERQGSVNQGSANRFGRDLGRLLRRRPDDERLSAGRTVIAGSVRVAGAGDRGPGLAVLAMLAWFEGRGGRSRLLLERARVDAPSVSLTGLVEDLLLGRVPPPWLRDGPGRVTK